MRGPSAPADAMSLSRGSGQAEYVAATRVTGKQSLSCCLAALESSVVQVPPAALGHGQLRAFVTGLAHKEAIGGLVANKLDLDVEQAGAILTAILASPSDEEFLLLQLQDNPRLTGTTALDIARVILHMQGAEALAALQVAGCPKLFQPPALSGFSWRPSAQNMFPPKQAPHTSLRRGASESPAPSPARGAGWGEHVELLDSPGFASARRLAPSFLLTGAVAPPSPSPPLSARSPPMQPASPVGSSPARASASPRHSKVSRAPARARGKDVRSVGAVMSAALLDDDMKELLSRTTMSPARTGKRKGQGRGQNRSTGAGSRQPAVNAQSPESGSAGIEHRQRPLHPAGVLTHAVMTSCGQLNELDFSECGLSPDVALTQLLVPLFSPASRVFSSLSTLSLGWNNIGSAALALVFPLKNKRLTAASVAAYLAEGSPKSTVVSKASPRSAATQRSSGPIAPQHVGPRAAQAKLLSAAAASADQWAAAVSEAALQGNTALGIERTQAERKLLVASLERAALAADVSKASAFHSCLAHLELPMAGIDDATGAALLAAASESSTLLTLDLSHNALRGLSAQEAERLLVNSTTLLALDLGFNPLGWRGTVQLVQALQANDSLVELSIENSLKDTMFSSTGSTAVPEAWHTPSEALAAVQPRTSKAGRRGRKASKQQEHQRQQQRRRGPAPTGGIRAPSPKRGGRSRASRSRPPTLAPPPVSAQAAEDVATDDVPLPPSQAEAYQVLHEIGVDIMAFRATFAQLNIEYPPRHRTIGSFRHKRIRRTASGRWSQMQIERGETDWSLHRSVWRPRLLEADSRAFFDTHSIMGRAFEADVHASKLSRLFKDAEQLTQVKVKLRRRYPVLRELFRYYCCTGSSAASGIDPFTQSFIQFTEFRRDAGIERKDLTQSLDLCFLTANAARPGERAGQREGGSEKHLMRHEFMEAVVRVALVMFPPDFDAPSGPATSLSRLLEHHIMPTAASLLNIGGDAMDPWSNSWRRTRMYTQAVDRVLRLYLPTLQDIFSTVARTISATELTHLTANASKSRQVGGRSRRLDATADTQRLYRKRFLFLPPFLDLTRRAGLMKKSSSMSAMGYQQWLNRKLGKASTLEPDESGETTFTRRDAMSIFVFSSMTVASEVHRDLRACRRCVHYALTFTEFLEAVCRLADSAACPSPQDVLGPENPSPQGRKVIDDTAATLQATGLQASAAAGAGEEVAADADILVPHSSFVSAGAAVKHVDSLSDIDAASVASSQHSEADAAPEPLAHQPPEELERRLPLVVTALAKAAGVSIQLNSTLEAE